MSLVWRTVAGSPVLGCLDHRRNSLDRVGVPADRGEVAPSQTGAGALVGRVGRLVHGVVIERRGHHLVEVVDRLDRREFVDVADHPGDMRGGVVAAVLLTMPCEEPVEERSVGGDVALPRDLQFEFSIAHRLSVPAVVAG